MFLKLFRSSAALLLFFVCSFSAFAQEVVTTVEGGVAGSGAAGNVANQASEPQMFSTIFMCMAIFAIFYFLVLLPQNKQLKAHENMLKELKKGAEVVTSGGLIGVVAGIEKDYILLEVANGVRVKILTSSISRKLEKAPVKA